MSGSEFTVVLWCVSILINIFFYRYVEHRIFPMVKQKQKTPKDWGLFEFWMMFVFAPLMVILCVLMVVVVYGMHCCTIIKKSINKVFNILKDKLGSTWSYLTDELSFKRRNRKSWEIVGESNAGKEMLTKKIVEDILKGKDV